MTAITRHLQNFSNSRRRRVAGAACAVILLAGVPLSALGQTDIPPPAAQQPLQPPEEPRGEVTPPKDAQPGGEPGAQPDGESGGGEPEAQPDGEPGSGELSPEELADIEAALGADASAVAVSQAPPAGGRSGVLSSMNPDLSFALDAGFAYFSDDTPLQTGVHDPQTTGFVFQQLEMAVGKTVDPYFRVDANIVFSPEEIDMEEAYATTLALPYSLQARVGQFLTHVGRINSTHPHAWDFVDQTLAIGRMFGGEGNRAPGAELSYLAPLPWYVLVTGTLNNATGEESARSFLAGQGLPIDSPLDLQTSLRVEQFFALGDDLSALFGLSYAGGPNPVGADARTHIFAADLFVKYRPISRASYTQVAFQAELFHRRRVFPAFAGRLTDWNGYAHVTWRFARRWAAAARYEFGTPARNQDGLTGLDDLDPEWTEFRQRAAVNLTFWPSEFSRVRVQGSVDDPAWRDDAIYALFFAFEFNIGAHSAHRF